jgi:hypothetical protein
VVREHLGVVLGSSQPVDPLGDGAMPSCAVCTRDLAVRHVTHERVCEGELALALERRAPLAADEALALEGMEGRGRGGRVATDRARPEDLPDDGRVLQEALIRLGEPVEARSDDALQRLGERELVGRALFHVELRELLRIQRVAARALEECPL